jgi:hypothetical protein
MNIQHVKDRLRETCVLFDGSESNLGSGFVVAPGYAATAAHVLPDHEAGATITVQVGWGPRARRVTATVCARDPVNDAAVLRLAGCDDIVPLAVDTALQGTPSWCGFGFPQAAALAGPLTGVPLGGEIYDSGWTSPGPGSVNQFILQCGQNVGSVSLRGVSGSAVAANGALVAMIVEEFRDPDNLGRSILGQLKALPIAAVLAMLPAGVQPLRLPATAVGQDVTRAVDLPMLFSWCDRKAVVARMNQWLDARPPARAGLLCIVGHMDNRPKLLVDRVALELSEQSATPVHASSAWVVDTDPEDEREFRRALYNALQLPEGAPVEQSPKLRGAGGTILLCQCCDFGGWSTRGVEQRLRQAAAWLASLPPARARVVMVVAIRHDRLLPFVSAGRRIDAAVARAVQECPALGALMLKQPLALADYEAKDVLDWADMPLVRRSIGSTASRINGTLLEQWFRRRRTASHGQLLDLLGKFHDGQHP